MKSCKQDYKTYNFGENFDIVHDMILKTYVFIDKLKIAIIHDYFNIINEWFKTRGENQKSCSKNLYPGGHTIYNFKRGLYSLSKYAVRFNSVSEEVKKKILKHCTFLYINTTTPI